MKKALSFILALALVISLVPTVAFAAGATKTFDFGDVVAWTNNANTTVKNINAPAGIEYIFEEGTQKKSTQTSLKQAGKDNLVQIHLKTGTWLTATAADMQQVVFTAYLDESFAAGWYQIAFTGANVEHASDLYIYANEKGTYVGEYISQKTSSSFAVGSTATFGAVYLKPDEGKVKFIVAPSKLADGQTNGYVILHSLSLTYLEDQSKYGYKISHNIPAEIDLTADATGVEFTAYADAGDGIPRTMNGRKSDRLTEGADSFSIEVEGESVEFTSMVTDGIASGTLVPVEEGDTIIKFTAIIDGETYTDTKTITVRGEKEDTDESVAAQEDVSYIVRGSKTEFNIGINITGYTAGEVGGHPLNTSFTAKALEEITIGDKEYNFAYWQTAGGSPIEGAGASYTFTPKSNFTLEAVYVPAEPTDADKKVQFWNYNRVYLGEEDVVDNKVKTMPDNPTLSGFKFEHWRTDVGEAFTKDTVLTDAITRVVAYFTAITDDFAVEFDTDGDGNVDKTIDADYGEEVTGTATGENFSYWAIDGKPVSYENEISFFAWNDVTVTAVYEGEKTAVPTVVLDSIGDEYFITYEVPADYTVIDAGIVFGSNDPRVDSTDGSKASVRDIKAKGQFTAVPHPDAEHSVARGYVMYTNADGENRVLYSK